MKQDRLVAGVTRKEIDQMRKMLFVSACVMAVSAGGAFAQNQPAPGASSQGNVGPGASGHMSNTQNKHKGMTTGSSTTRRHQKGTGSGSSSQGNVGPGTKE
jgi:hypothetical protein